MEEVGKLLQQQLKPWRDCHALTGYLKHLSTVRFRYKFFVMVGDSMTAKTQRLKHAFGDPGLVLEINCANCPEPDIRAYNPLKHKGILYDEGSPSMVLAQKKLFQSQNALVVLGSSTTNCHSYSKWVHGCAQFITSNTWIEELEALSSPADKSWLRDNSIVVNVGSALQYMK